MSRSKLVRADEQNLELTARFNRGHLCNLCVGRRSVLHTASFSTAAFLILLTDSDRFFFGFYASIMESRLCSRLVSFLTLTHVTTNAKSMKSHTYTRRQALVCPCRNNTRLHTDKFNVRSLILVFIC